MNEGPEGERPKTGARYKAPKEKNPVEGFDRAIKAVRSLSSTPPTHDGFEGYREEVDSVAHDRGAVVLLTTNLETALEAAIVRRLRIKGALKADLFGMNGPAGTLHAKILMADAIGLLGPQARRNLDIIRVVRNTFAHANVSLKLEHPDIEKLCRFLKIPPAVKFGDKWMEPPPRAEGMSDCRYVFQTVCVAMQFLLLTREIAGPTGIDLNGLKAPIRDSIKSVVGEDAEIWAVLPSLP